MADVIDLEAVSVRFGTRWNGCAVSVSDFSNVNFE
ncbi:hypothetical protein XHC_3364 [Xanthomonas hortorum pv. carotae str. M081]|nr:hypothetical protein XHC_3364 [Xanthomonas hortorum pv. carotae str. M081]